MEYRGRCAVCARNEAVKLRRVDDINVPVCQECDGLPDDSDHGDASIRLALETGIASGKIACRGIVDLRGPAQG